MKDYKLEKFEDILFSLYQASEWIDAEKIAEIKNELYIKIEDYVLKFWNRKTKELEIEDWNNYDTDMRILFCEMASYFRDNQEDEVEEEEEEG